MSDFLKGFDVSSLLEVEGHGGRFFDFDGRERDLLDILRSCGGNCLRLRLWNDPRDGQGRSYGGGTCDLDTVLTLAKRGAEKGFSWLLALIYSDFWADPGKQTVPKAWQGLDEAGLEEAVYRFTRQTLERCVAEGVPPGMVQVGNETTGGLLWPTGRVPSWDTMVRYLSAGVRAVREVLPQAQVMIHLDHGASAAVYNEWFDHFFARGGDCDLIGLSFYPFWHGTIHGLKENLDQLAPRYGKDLVIVETSMGFTLDDYGAYEALAPEARKGAAAKAALADRVPFPMTPQGQADYTRTLLDILRNVPDGRGRGLFWWEPGWVPVPGVGWAEKAGWEYVGEQGPGGNEWANQALFDYQGRALPALRVIGDF